MSLEIAPTSNGFAIEEQKASSASSNPPTLQPASVEVEVEVDRLQSHRWLVIDGPVYGVP